MILTTKTKIAMAGLAYRAIAMGRAVLGRDDCVSAERGGLKWCLDLREGIDFSIYLLGAFERSTVRARETETQPGPQSGTRIAHSRSPNSSSRRDRGPAPTDDLRKLATPGKGNR